MIVRFPARPGKNRVVRWVRAATDIAVFCGIAFVVLAGFLAVFVVMILVGTPVGWVVAVILVLWALGVI